MLGCTVGAEVPLPGHVPIEPLLVSAGDDGVPLVLSAPDSPAGQELRKVADALSSRKRGWHGCRWAWIRPDASPSLGLPPR